MDYVKRAVELFVSGYNCSQSVFGAFCDVVGMDFETAIKLASSFGGGMGRMREVCGACSGMFMIAGLLDGYSDPADNKSKAEHYALIQRLAGEFKKKNNGTFICRELLKNHKCDCSPEPTPRTADYYKTRPCVKYVEDAAEIVEKYLKETGRIQTRG